MYQDKHKSFGPTIDKKPGLLLVFRFTQPMIEGLCGLSFAEAIEGVVLVMYLNTGYRAVSIVRITATATAHIGVVVGG